MNKNIGTIDRVFRVVFGLLILVLGIVYSSWLGLIGLMPIITALAGRCPAYLPFSITTCKKVEAKQE